MGGDLREHQDESGEVSQERECFNVQPTPVSNWSSTPLGPLEGRWNTPQIVPPGKGEEVGIFIHPSDHPPLVEGCRGTGLNFPAQLAPYASSVGLSSQRKPSLGSRLPLLGTSWGPHGWEWSGQATHSICYKATQLIRRRQICPIRSELGLELGCET